MTNHNNATVTRSGSGAAHIGHHMTGAAWSWATSCYSIIEAHFSPDLFLGKKLQQIANLLQRPIELDEVRRLVKVDGPLARCAITGEWFQPVRYLGRIDEALTSDLRRGKEYHQWRISYGGCFYVLPSLNGKRIMTIAVSGSMYFYNADGKQYMYSDKSPMMTFAQAMGYDSHAHARYFWGCTLEKAKALVHANVCSGHSHAKSIELLSRESYGNLEAKK